MLGVLERRGRVSGTGLIERERVLRAGVLMVSEMEGSRR